MEVMVRPPRTGLEAFDLMPEGTRCQLINDNLVMSPAPTTPHALTQRKIFSALNNYVEQRQLGEVFFAPVDVYLNEKNVFQPDIFFIAASRRDIIEEKGILGAPDLVIEVLSKGNHKYDLIEKKTAYCLSGVKEYWVVDPQSKKCEGFILENEQYKSGGESMGEFTIRILNLPIAF